ncbi:MAG: ABC transporter ATP-binding protein [Clostridium sp.]|uniref:Aliphatic sulfonates import ATP-binding protein SsuB n=1 Tax=Clostridium paraputrificum TaxID=29363 RepID=A0A6N3GIN4_9CLOT|nr:ABC transporter ATP-binding protein [Clostridium sp.]MBS5925875.1 ABC transporter ATP-binding protein [Clostridium sp.]
MSSYQNKILLRGISKSFDNMVILNDINIEVNEGELVSIVGPSGSGKSTIFNIITNLIKFDSGEKRVNGDVSYMYQKDMMVPWKKVVDNIATPLVFKGMDKKNARKEVEKYIGTFGLNGFQNKYPNKLSGGMKQRANFLQTYLTSNDIMLLDEPFGALDSITRSNMQQWLLDIKKNMNSTILLITHDVDEAVLLSDRVYVISEKPAVIKGEVKVNLPKERGEETKLTEEFLLIKREVTDIMKK